MEGNEAVIWLRIRHSLNKLSLLHIAAGMLLHCYYILFQSAALDVHQISSGHLEQSFATTFTKYK